MALEVGSRLGHYDVTALIGEGGMGQVYQATDTKLKRQVALKILPEAFSADPERLARFQREAEVLASLNHPNIAAIHGLEEADGIRALVLELVEGPTLADRIKQGPIRLDEALPIAKQIAEALEAAHEAGVIHRDLKPANIKVRDDGAVKVLDFGLAKAFQPDASDPSLSQSPTISLTAAATQMGMVIGTAAYMAPEQAKGLPVDKRADIWAFGAVLFEMLTGRKLFEAGDVSEMLASVLIKDPDISSMGSHVPDYVRSLVRRCLVKDPRQRMRDIGDVRLAMEGAFETTVSQPSVAVARNLQVWQRPVVIAAAALVIGGLAVWALTRPESVALRVERFAIPPPAPVKVRISPTRRDIAISPDGTRVVYATDLAGENSPQLYVRPVDALTATLLQGLGNIAFGPFVSPDSAWLGFVTGSGSQAPDYVLKRVSILGGPTITICNTGGLTLGADWADDNTIIFGTIASSGLWRVSANGGDPEELTMLGAEDGVNHGWPHVLPGSRAVLFTILAGNAIEQAQIAVLNVETGEQRVLVSGGSAARYASTGHIVYGVGGTLRAVGFDLDRLELTNPNPVPVLPGVVTKSSGAANFDLARDGSLVYVAGQVSGGAERTLVWVDREGNEEPLDLPPRAYGWPRLSPDATRLLVTIQDPENVDVWIADVTRGTLAKLTTDPARDVNGLWTPDGERVVFMSQREGVGLYWVAADGTGDVEQLMTIEDARYIRPYGWSPDGNTLVFEYAMVDFSPEIGVLSMEGDRTWEPLIHTAAAERAPAISPDGQWIAYTSNETGDRLVYVARFPDLTGRLTVSRGHAHDPVWAPDGRELFHLSTVNDSVTTVVPVEPGTNLRLGEATDLFEGDYVVSNQFRQWGVSPDGRFLRLRALSTSRTETDAVPEAILVKNWFQDLRRLVPVD